jgi:membrane fusion protein (multidrug efflux system)
MGDRVEPGQQLMALTQTADLWVAANFRETRIRKMRPGQPVRVRVDAEL